MKRNFLPPRGYLGGILLAAAVAVLLWSPPGYARFAMGRPMPQFSVTSPDKWLNSKPLTREHLKGKVVLLEIWTSV